MKTILGYAGLIVFLVVAFDFAKSYMTSTSAGWQRVIDAGRGSATIVVQQFTVAIAGLTAAADEVTDLICSLIGDPAAADPIKNTINSVLKPEYVGAAVAIFGVLTVAARLRTLKK